jgi:hypothetical protein
VKKLVGLFVEGANVLDLCVEGDKLIEEGTSAVYNKSVKGVKVSKGSSCAILLSLFPKTPPYVPYNGRLTDCFFFFLSTLVVQDSRFQRASQ